MSQTEFEVGDEVRFCPDKGEVVDVKNSADYQLLKILTTSGYAKLIPTNIPHLQKI